MHNLRDLHLIAEHSASVAPRVVDYQFGAGDNWFDSNWLVIAGEVSCSDGTWSFRDSCLPTTEATPLGHWLEALKRFPSR